MSQPRTFKCRIADETATTDIEASCSQHAAEDYAEKIFDADAKGWKDCDVIVTDAAGDETTFFVTAEPEMFFYANVKE